MFKIVRFPSKFNNFFSSLKTEFRFGHFEYFKILVLLIAFVWERRNIASMYRYLDATSFPHRTRFNNFLSVGRWKPEQVLALKAYELLHALRPQEGETLYLVIDDSKKGKRGKKMEAAGWVYDPLTGKSIWGHQYVKATLLFRGYTIPFGIRLYVKKEKSSALELRFQKTTQLAAELIWEFSPPAGVHVVVLFDSFYLCSAVAYTCRERGFHFVSTVKSN